MSKKIVTLPHKELRKRSKMVSYIGADIKELVKNMAEATLEWEDSREHEIGVALAAVQINIHKRVVIIRNDFDDKKDRSFNIYINPEITAYEGEIVEEFEGCLSVKDIYGKVPRHEKVVVKAKDLDGNEVRLSAEGFLARIFQHEIDHTNGILFVDRIKDAPEAFYRLEQTGNIRKLADGEREEAFSILW